MSPHVIEARFLCGILPACLHLTGPDPLRATLAFQDETLSALVAHWASTVAASVVSFLLILAIKEYRADRRSRQDTRVKANLCFDDLTERKPEMERHFNALMEHGWGRR